MVCSPGSADQIRSSKLAGLAGRHHHGLARPEEFADQAVRQRRDAPAQPGGQACGGYQPQPVVLDEHEPAGVRAGQLPQAGRDPVEHRLQVALRVHVRDHIAETAHHPRALGHVVPGHVVLAGLVADVHPADHAAAAVGQRAGVDAHVEHGAVLADPPGGEGDLAAAADPLEHRVVLGAELFWNDRRLQADDLGGAPAEHPFRRGVPQQHGAIGPEGHDRVGGALDHRARCRVHPVPRVRQPRMFCHHVFIVPPGRTRDSERALLPPPGASAMAARAPIVLAVRHARTRITRRRLGIARIYVCSA